MASAHLGKFLFTLASAALVVSLAAVGVLLLQSLALPGRILSGDTLSLTWGYLAVALSAVGVACSVPMMKGENLLSVLRRIDLAKFAPIAATIVIGMAIPVVCFVVPLILYLNGSPSLPGLLLAIALGFCFTLLAMFVGLPFIAERVGAIAIEKPFKERLKDRFATLGRLVAFDFIPTLFLYAVVLGALGFGAIFSSN